MYKTSHTCTCTYVLKQPNSTFAILSSSFSLCKVWLCCLLVLWYTFSFIVSSFKLVDSDCKASCKEVHSHSVSSALVPMPIHSFVMLHIFQSTLTTTWPCKLVISCSCLSHLITFTSVCFTNSAFWSLHLFSNSDSCCSLAHAVFILSCCFCSVVFQLVL